MPIYLYHALDASGSEVTGQMAAANEADVRDQLRARGEVVRTLQAISTRHAPPLWGWYVWSSLFLAGGGLFLYFLGVQPLGGILQATRWVETPCTILASELKEHLATGDDTFGLTYSIQIAYQYEFQGTRYQADRYNFVTGSSNTHIAQRSGIVRAHPPGKQTVCFVNPANPAEAVLNRGWAAEMWWGLFPLPFVMISSWQKP